MTRKKTDPRQSAFPFLKSDSQTARQPDSQKKRKKPAHKKLASRKKPARKSSRKKPILNAALGDQLKAQALVDVEAGADPAWRAQAQKAILRVAKKKKLFTSDDVWQTGLPRPREPRALGPEMNSAELDGIMVTTNGFKLTAQASRHRAPVRIWQSLVFKGKFNPLACAGCGKVTDLYVGGLCDKCGQASDAGVPPPPGLEEFERLRRSSMKAIRQAVVRASTAKAKKKSSTKRCKKNKKQRRKR